jgi:ElaB/YqjD/DUF883 family membrane-anchored ribosome-binding protein
MSRHSHLLPCCLLPAVAFAILASTLTGCAPAAKPKEPAKATATSGHHDHDHSEHAHPETLAEGLAELEATTADIASKLASNAQDAADDALHAAGHLVEDLHGLIEKQPDLSAEARAAGKLALDELFECFDTLDTAMHAGADEAKQTVAEVHASVKERIEAALSSLKDTFGTEAK